MDFPPVPSPRASWALAGVGRRYDRLFTEVTTLNPGRHSQFGVRSDIGNEVVPHKVLDDTVELGALVTKSRRANSQGPKVLGGLGNGLSLENSGQSPRKR